MAALRARCLAIQRFSPCSQVTLLPKSLLPKKLRPYRRLLITSATAAPDNGDQTSTETATTVPDTDDPPTPPPKSNLKKGNIVRVEKEKYLNSINYLSVGHPKFYKGIDYIYEDRGEILDIREFVTGEYALISWVGIPTAPAWLPTYMLIKSDKLSYKRT